MPGIATRVGAVLAAAFSLSVVVLLQAAPAPAPRQERQVADYSGNELFRTYCAVCHGPSARGDGPLAASMKKRPPDLTQFSKQNNGTFPAEMVFKIIDGREPVAGHGGKDMPVWGDAFKRSAVGGSEDAVKARIQALVTYIERLQEKSPQQ